MKNKIISTIIITLIPLVSLFSNRVNYESEEVEFPRSASFTFFVIQKDSISKEYYKAIDKFKRKEFSEALELSFVALEKSNAQEEIINVNYLIGNIFRKTNNHNRAIKYYLNTLEYFKNNASIIQENNLINEDLLSNLYYRLATEYQLNKNIDSSLFYYDKLFELNLINKKASLLKSNAYNNLSAIYRDNSSLKDLTKAKFFINKALDINKVFGENLVLASNYGNLANIFMEEENFNKAKSLYLKAIKLLENDNREEAVKYKEVLYDNIGWTLYNMKNYRAYEYLDKSVAIRDSINDIGLRKAIKEIETRNNVELATKDAESKRIIAEKNELQANQTTWLVGIAGFATIALLLYLVNVYKLRQQKLKTQLSENELIQQKDIEKIKLESQIKILNATLDGKETERKQIAETLHDNVSALLSSANLHLQASQKQFNGNIPVELDKTQEIIKQASQQIRDLSHNLVSSILLKFGLEYAIKDTADKFSNSEISFFTKIEGVRRYDQSFEIKVYNMVQEFANNILKHSKANEAFLSAKEENGVLEILVEDNGKGFNSEDPINKDGIGLNQINARVKMLNGTFVIDSAENEGTKIKITLPIQERKKTFIV
ncbi:tetratricopeptide repeat-containing sensor histidine kinase [Tenacibaculum todarodis]|uniref:tetratricopeptide repeat-containing sensor histidine kinase n=1 Tax=Tenacibaculum todarodis TaxID=1850252 RepID=UPI0009F6650F|nr:tetratricopeptide repeat-containing sensor histidine kinase [Tenacibaculum todarodis]